MSGRDDRYFFKWLARSSRTNLFELLVAAMAAIGWICVILAILSSNLVGPLVQKCSSWPFFAGLEMVV